MKYLEALGLMLISIFAPIQAVLATTLALIAVDLISGVVAAAKRGEKITSAGFRRSISKLIVYEVALMIGFVAETYMLPFLPVTKMISSLISLTELKSIFENMDSASGGGLLKTIIDKLGSENAQPKD